MEGHKSLSDAIKKATNEGYQSAFRFSKGKLIDRTSKKTYSIEECVIDRTYRIEGLSDPADNSILVLISCRYGAKGHISSAYGIYADTELMSFLLSLERKQPKD